jgi:dihydroxyacetone kinase-like protein
LADMPLNENDEVAIMVNGLGATPLEELYICYKEAYEYLKNKGVSVYKPYIGEFATSMEMAGMSLSVLKLDDTLKELLDYDATTPFFTNYNK